MILRMHAGLSVHNNTHTWAVYKHLHLCKTSLYNILSSLREDRQNTLVLYFYQLLSESFLHRQWFNAYLKSGNTCHAFIDRLSVSFSGEKVFLWFMLIVLCSFFPPFFLILSTFLFLSSSSRSFSKLHSFSVFFFLSIIFLFSFTAVKTHKPSFNILL